MLSSVVVSNVLKQQAEALGRLGWSLRQIEKAIRVRRETFSIYLKAAGILIRAPRGPVHTGKTGQPGRRGDLRPCRTKTGQPR
ncbi:MAG: hypothetical protein JWN34_1572 [Bryobacterales bacterium]|nr:hypothetical protein [Bryobacterales bacterium]